MALAVLTSLAVLVVGLFWSGTDVLPYALVPVLMLVRPWLGVLAGFGAGAYLAASPDWTWVRIVFGLHALLCLVVLAGFRWRMRAQRRVFAEVAAPVALDLPGDLTVKTRTRLLPVMTVLLGGTGVGLGFLAAQWWWLTGLFVVAACTRMVAAQVLPPRLLAGRGVGLLVRADENGRVVLVTEALNPVASFNVAQVMHRRDSEDPMLTLGNDEPGRTPLVPATVIGDLRVGGWVLVVTDDCLLLPNGPVRDDHEAAMTMPSSLADGRRWSGLQP